MVGVTISYYCYLSVSGVVGITSSGLGGAVGTGGGSYLLGVYDYLSVTSVSFNCK